MSITKIMADESTTPYFSQCTPSSSEICPKIFNSCAPLAQPPVTTLNGMYDYGSSTLSALLSCSDQLEAATWTPEPRAVADIERGLRYGEKMEAIEITTKDLSPASCYSNLDFTIPDIYKNLGYYSSKPEVNQWQWSQFCYNTFNSEPSEKFYSQACMYSGTRDYVDETLYCVQNQDPLVYSHADVSNDSDIVVEDLEDNDNCIVCKVGGNDLLALTAYNPLTMFSQKPVLHKLTQIVGMFEDKMKLCSHCLTVINDIDHLESKLKCEKEQLRSRYKQNNPAASCSNKVQFCNFRGMYGFRCKVCKKLFTLRKLYNSHLNRHKLKNKYLCELCGYRFTTLSRLKVHLQIHIIKKQWFKCSTCCKEFRSASNLKSHINVCSALLPHICKHLGCDKKFATSTRLKNHVKLRHDQKFVAICSICNIGFVKPSDYKAHKTSHSTEKKFKCTMCEKMYKTIGNLNYHLKFHDQVLPFLCSICNKGFMRKDYLETHINNHNGIKNYACNFCSKKFVAQKNLDAHVKYHEGSIKRKVCGICNKSMSTGFEEHLRTHSNLLEFDCDLCSLKFNTKGALAKHKKRKHTN